MSRSVLRKGVISCNECGSKVPLLGSGASLDSPSDSLDSQHHVKISLHGQPSRFLRDDWEFAGWGQTIRLEIPTAFPQTEPLPKKLGMWHATAIAANDLTSSVFFSVGLAITVSGQYAPICMFLSGLSLIPLRYVLAEIGEALPLNGAMYSTLVSMSKLSAIWAAGVLAMDYTTTAVVSAASAASYLMTMTSTVQSAWIVPLILVVFCIITAIGLRESSGLALSIFILHILTMLGIIILSIVFMASGHGFGVLLDNWNSPAPSGNIARDILFGWAVAFLSSTGFETSGNYIEDQAPGVFPLTLRNMTYLSLFFPPLLTFLTLCVLPRDVVVQNPSTVLSAVASAVSSQLGFLVSLDAIIVLCGGVLTSFVGIGGLAHHLAGDGLLPRAATKKMPPFGGYPAISIGFFLICGTLFLISNGDMTILSLVFAMSFLMVLLLSTMANLFLKYQRGRLPRTVDASLHTVLLGLAILITAIVGTAVQNTSAVVVFFGMWCTIVLCFWIVSRRVAIAKIILFLLERTKDARIEAYSSRLIRYIQAVRNQPVAFFTNHDEIHVLNKALRYMDTNESATAHMKVVHMFEDEATIPPSLEFNIYILDHVYPKIKVDLVLVRGKFEPDSLKWVADQLGIPVNLCFIATPGVSSHPIGDFKGARVIML
ncbi:hypothetical protein SmJEL517_g04663 [Synchytrium microbalum]|uniref:Amino acid permease/ SLC12A domain-containing protein n=1 Tax=Synchytrium microbalum TaxID=1806994 RepID=A0A507C3Q6_9FUNG|nr:uncharacterized protein SmJEL517_g04663 [Synchytrium microbalum]TPX32195.1 hypothetical protein SmJEL517_g04663 [Synchytrium microbalum]